MGCIPLSQEEKKLISKQDAMRWMDSPVGKLTIELKDLYLQKLQDREEKKEDLMLVIKLSSEEERIPLKDLLDKKNPRKITFAINSCYKLFGRYLSLQVWNLHSGNAIDIGLGIVDLHQEMNQQFKTSGEFSKFIKVCLNYRESPAGYINLKTNFYATKYENISFKIFGAVFRSAIGKSFQNSHCITRLIIGEEVLQTKSINSQTNYLNFEGEEMKFRLPDYITEGKVYVIDRVGSSDIILGEMIINLTTLLEGNRQKPINECLDVDEVLTGKINMVFIRGASSQAPYLELDSPRKIGRNTKNRLIHHHPVRKDSEESNLQQSTTIIESDLELSQKIERNRNISLPSIDVKKALERLNFKRKKMHEH